MASFILSSSSSVLQQRNRKTFQSSSTSKRIMIRNEEPPNEEEKSPSEECPMPSTTRREKSDKIHRREKEIKQMIGNLRTMDDNPHKGCPVSNLYNIVEEDSIGSAGSFDSAGSYGSSSSKEEKGKVIDVTDYDNKSSDDPKNAREAVEMAVKLNTELGHENYGALSFSHGFAPMVTPTPKLPSEFQAWDDFAERMPQLLSSGRFRLYCEKELPELDPTNLPPQYSLRAAQILGYGLHSYWNVAGLKTPTSVPKALEEPWKAICKDHLGRSEPFMGFHELLIHSFWFDSAKNQIPPTPSDEHACPYKRDENGCVEYNPLEVKLGTFSPTMSLTGSQAEYVFYGCMAEMHCRGAGLVQKVVEAQEFAKNLDEASSEKDTSDALEFLEKTLADIKDLLDLLTMESFAKIHQMKQAEFFVDPAIWSKVVAPVAVPIYESKVGPSGTAAPIFIALDAFFGRTQYSNFVGTEMQMLTKLMPKNWRRFVDALRFGPKVGQIVSMKGTGKLKGLFSACLRAYAGDAGFLGRHTLKMAGYLEVGMKLGRSVTLGGFAGLLKDRAWEKVTKHLRVAQEDRLELGLDAETTLCQSATVIPNKGKGDSGEKTYHVRLDISESGIRYRPGDRIGVLWEASDELIRKTIHALANGSSQRATIIEEKHVLLNDRWKQALRFRPKYYKATHAHDKLIIPDSLPLREFLRYARLRPASRECVLSAYQATLDPWLHGFLQSGRESMLEACDVIKLIFRTHPSAGDMLLRGVRTKTTRDSMFLNKRSASVQGRLETGYDRLFQNADANGDGHLDKSEVIAISNLIHGKNSKDMISFLFNQMGGNDKEVITKEKFIKMAKLGLVRIPMLCELLEPANFRVYSIASASGATPAGELHLCVNKVLYAQKDPVQNVSPLLSDLQPVYEHRGAASSYLGQLCDSNLPLSANRKITIRHFQPPSFQLPQEDQDSSVLMFAAGSGIAPFRSFWQALATRQSKRIASGQKPPPKALLVLQARSRNHVPFAEELASLVAADLLDVYIALSREAFKPDFSTGKLNWIPDKKEYVHEKIAKEADLRDRIARELCADGKGHVYVCSGGGFAKSVMDAIDGVIGEVAAEKMMASGRLSLEVFTSLKGPDEALPDTWISDLIFCNDFNGREASIVGEQRSSKQLRLVIDGLIYDMSSFAKKHPGGRQLLYLYTGTDASKPWKSTGHYRAPEVASLLEMYLVARLRTKDRDTDLLASSVKLPLFLSDVDDKDSNEEQKLTQNNLSKCPFSQKNLYSGTEKQFLSSDGYSSTSSPLESTDSFDASFKELEITKSNGETTLSSWYSDSWLPLTYLLVEAQNAVTLAYMQNWDSGVLTSAEPHEQDCHFCTWDGVTVLRPKRSVLKGQMLADAHRRVWFEYIPTILGNEFMSAVAPLKKEKVLDRLTTLASSDIHGNAATVVPILEAVTDGLGLEEPSTGYVPAKLHAAMEAVRCMDEKVLSLIKVGVSKALKAFESYQPARVFREEEEAEVDVLLSNVEAAVLEIVTALENYCDDLQKLVHECFEEDSAVLSKAAASLDNVTNLGCVSKFMKGVTCSSLVATRNLVGVGDTNAESVFVETLANHKVENGEGKSSMEQEQFVRSIFTRRTSSWRSNYDIA